MKITVEKAAASFAALRILSGVPLPGLLAYRVAKLARALRPIAESYDEARNAALRNHGTPVADRPGVFGLSDPGKFNEEMETVGKREEELDIDPAPIAPSQLEKVELPASVFLDLDWLIRE